MFGQNVKAKSPREYIDALDSPRREEIEQIHQFIQQVLPKKGYDAHILMGMIAYGKFHYVYPSGREGDWSRVGLCSNKQYISLYVCACDTKQYVAEKYKKRLPKASIGKSCVRFKRFDDLDENAVRDMLVEAVKVGFPAIEKSGPKKTAKKAKRAK